MTAKKWRCPLATEDGRFRFLMCRKTQEKVFKNGERAADATEAAQAMCVYQKYCSCSGKMENTDTARKCYENRLDRA